MNGIMPKGYCFYSIAEESADMRKTISCFAAVVMVILATLIFAGPAPAQEAKFDSDTISGLGARNIGSAAMSGRVAAVAPSKKTAVLLFMLERPVVECGNPRMAAQRLSPFSTRRLRNRLAPSPSIRKRRKRSGRHG